MEVSVVVVVTGIQIQIKYHYNSGKRKVIRKQTKHMSILYYRNTLSVYSELFQLVKLTLGHALFKKEPLPPSHRRHRLLFLRRNLNAMCYPLLCRFLPS